MTIFSMAIQYMREHLMETLNKQVTHVEESDVMFVITVPAIWSDASKQFMREAAITVRWLEMSINLSSVRFSLEFCSVPGLLYFIHLTCHVGLT